MIGRFKFKILCCVLQVGPKALRLSPAWGRGRPGGLCGVKGFNPGPSWAGPPHL